MKSSFVNVFGKLTAAAAISLFINIPSQANAVPDLCGFNREYFLKQHAPKLKETYETQFSFNDEEGSSLPLITDETLKQEALDKGYSWVYGCPKDLNLHEASRLNPWIKESFVESFPTVTSTSIDEMEFKAFYMRYVQDAVLTTFYNSTPLMWVEGVSPDFDWQDANSVLGKAKTPGENWIERAHDLQVQARDKRLEKAKRGLGTTFTANLTTRHLWAADIIVRDHTELVWNQVLTELSEAAPKRLESEDSLYSEYQKIHDEWTAKARAIELLNGYEDRVAVLEKSALNASFSRKNAYIFSHDLRNFAIRQRINTLNAFLTKEKTKIQEATLGRESGDAIIQFETNTKSFFGFAESYIHWLNTNEISLPDHVTIQGLVPQDMSGYSIIFLEDFNSSLETYIAQVPKQFILTMLTQSSKSKKLSDKNLKTNIERVMGGLKLRLAITDGKAKSNADITSAISFSTEGQRYKTYIYDKKGKSKRNSDIEGTTKKQKKQKKTYTNTFIISDNKDIELFRFFIVKRANSAFTIQLVPTGLTAEARAM